MTLILSRKRKAALLLFCGTIFFQLLLSQPVLAKDDCKIRYVIAIDKPVNHLSDINREEFSVTYERLLTELLNQSGRCLVLSEKDLSPQKKTTEDFSTTLPAQFMIKGEITAVKDSSPVESICTSEAAPSAIVSITLHVLDTGTEQFLGSTTVTGTASESVTNNFPYGKESSRKHKLCQPSSTAVALENAVFHGNQWLIAQLAKIPWKGQVSQIVDNKIYINRGSKEGLHQGQTFSVGRATVLKDPVTGEVLDECVNEIALIEVISCKAQVSECRILRGDQKAITEGMLVQIR